MDWLKQIPRYIYLILGVIIGIFIVIAFKGCEKNGIDPSTTYTKTDTVWKEIPILIPTIPKDSVIPKTITKYLTDTFEIAFVDSVYVHDTIILHKKDGNPLFIPWGFIRKYPKAPKLIQGHFTKDSLELMLLNTNADLENKFWPINLDRFNYVYSDGKLTQSERKDFKQLPNIRKNFYLESNAYVGYNPFNKGITVSLDGSFMYKRAGVYIRGGLGSTNYAEGGIRIKLK